MEGGRGEGGFEGGSQSFQEEQKGDDRPPPTECKEVTGWGGGEEGKGG